MNDWVEAYNNNTLTLILEPSTYCNAKCPQCSRTNAVKGKDGSIHNLDKVDYLTLKHWTLKQFKHRLPKETLTHVKSISFTGSYGDPGMNPELPEIIDYIRSCNYKTSFNIHTNGSMQTELWWYRLGMIGKEKLKIAFAIDGVDQEMHAKYRRGTDLSKVLRNMKVMMETPVTIKCSTVLFKHSQDYLEQIQDMARAHGATDFMHCESNRFSKQATHSFINEQGDIETLEEVTRQDVMRDPAAITRIMRDRRHIAERETYNQIDCAAIKKTSLNISVDGIVYPCCYITVPFNNVLNYGVPSSTLEKLDVFQQLKENFFMYSLNSFSLLEIMSNDWYTNKLPESWKDVQNTATPACKRICGKCK